MKEQLVRALKLAGVNRQRKRASQVNRMREDYSAEHPGEREHFEALEAELADTADPEKRAELEEELANSDYYRAVDLEVQDVEHDFLKAQQGVAGIQSKN